MRVFLLLVPGGVRVLQFSAVSMGTGDGSRTFMFVIVTMRICVRCVGGSARPAFGCAVGRVGARCVPVMRIS